MRTSYDLITEHLPKATYLKRTFEDRYLESLKTKADLMFFLKGEQEFLECFMDEAEDIKNRKEACKERNEGGFAENVLKEIQAGIANYPTLSALDSHCITEVSRLYGAVRQFIEHYWDSIAYYMRGTSSDMGVEVDHLERSLSDVYSIAEDCPPKAVESYNEIARKSIGTSAKRIRTGQSTIQFAGTWLDNLQHILEAAIDQEEPPEDIRAACVKLSKIIQDFRLEAFAKRKASI